ncbi:hypothetical protein Pmani_017442 [Petrolisthes manimaculis]|uniref:Cytokine-inducible SH2-containing protein n=1 Tax=Petrolisthes manimaculis TaxID=1843537 RepID=A0AAE1U5T0_9EUCA|nr:hypothetical protein Pmani_017442 [Petrolisthes manimaculis]
MLTCPSCHHVLAAPSCCCGSLALLTPTPPAVPHTQAPTQTPAAPASSLGGPPRLAPFTTPHHHHHQQHQHHHRHNGHHQHHHHHHLHHQQLTPLATPHVSGHMFHFPSVGGCTPMLCQTSLQPPCMTTTCSRTPIVCGGEWQWSDNASPAPPHSATLAPALATRMHTSGGGIVDDVAKLDVGGAGCMGLGGWGVSSGNGVCSGQVQGLMGYEDDPTLTNTRNALQQSGWYWEQVSWREAETLLHHTSLGTFLVRDSSDARYLFSLSVQTERGPTSVRIHYSQGRFRLDCEAAVTTTMPDFPHLITLVEHYVKLNRKMQRHVWVDAKGHVFSPITITKPLKRSVPSLKHLSRLAINLTCPLPATTTLTLPPPLSQYLTDYPFWC